MQAQLASLPLGCNAGAASERLHEADLQNALASSLQAQLGAIVRREQPVRGRVEMWKGDYGPVDIAILTPVGAPRALIETKWCSDDKLEESLWDIVRLTALLATDDIHACFLVTGAPEAGWQERPGRPTELYADREITTAELLSGHSKGWAYCLKGSGARAKVVPAAFHTTLVATVPIHMSDEHGPWLLKCVAIDSPDGKLSMSTDGTPQQQ
jgi:hypothetical protein